ncbi:hypothetical protein CRUP_014717, partial [Coryphaenoides rupestris]
MSDEIEAPAAEGRGAPTPTGGAAAAEPRWWTAQRCSGSDEDFYTRPFWKLVEPAVNAKMVRITEAKAASASSSEFSQSTTKLPPIDELLLFLMHLSVGLPLRDLAER